MDLLLCCIQEVTETIESCDSLFKKISLYIYIIINIYIINIMVQNTGEAKRKALLQCT